MKKRSVIMSREYTEVIENSYPTFMKDKWIEYRQYLERELRKAKVKIARLEAKEQDHLDKIFSRVGGEGNGR